MGRRAVIFTQAEVARVARVAAALGPPWEVEVSGGVIRLVRGARAAPPPEPEPEPEPPPTGRGLPWIP